MKERHIILGVLLLTFVALAASFLLPSKRHQLPQALPWQITPTVDGSISVFGLTLGKSTLKDAKIQFREEVEVSLFAADQDKFEVEAYFDSVDTNGLRAKIVMSMLLSEAERKAMYERGVRIANMGSGTRRVSLSEADLTMIVSTPIAAITYLPRVNLTAESIIKHFGRPSLRIQEKDKSAEHWLYPDSGLDVVLSEQGSDLLQYVMPTRFDSLMQPLLKEGLVLEE